VRLAVAPDHVTVGGEIVIDRLGRMPGRGAYLCRGAAADAPDVACLRLAERRGGLARALRSRVPMSHELVESLAGA
jgi:predicted RNA-binding protein YlxR (DUF448 family)